MVKFNRLNRTDRQIGFLLFAIALAIYLRMDAPDLLAGDAGEFQFAAWRWGLAHPTGYPLYLALGGLWQHGVGLFGIGPAAAINSLSGIIGALAVALLYFLMRQWLPGNLVTARIVALFTAALFAVNPTFWSQNLIAEVYTLHTVFILLIFLAAQSIETAYSRNPTEGPFLRKLLLLAFLFGLSLTHHGMTLILLPGLLIFLYLLDRNMWRSRRVWIGSLLAILLPLLLYLYIPLRSGPGASPWYHQRLGEGVLVLYDGTWQAFWDYVSGRAISVGFYSPGRALENISQASLLWRLHFGWPGLILIILGMAHLIRHGRRPLLAITLIYAGLQQIFNLFYAIDDILVYYIPIYLMAAIWAGFGAYSLAIGDWYSIGSASQADDDPVAQAAPDVSTQAGQASDEVETDTLQPTTDSNSVPGIDSKSAAPRLDGAQAMGLLIMLLLFLLPMRTARTYWARLDQSDSHRARTEWENIMAAEPPQNAILISNDRNEIVPLFYLQTVEGRALGNTGLFPLIAPEERFADIGSTIATALNDGAPQPVYLTKEMPGLEARFELAPATSPLYRVLGPAAAEEAAYPVNGALGPLTLVGYDWQPEGEEVSVEIQWLVDEKLDDDYTTSVQIFDANGQKIGQHDGPPGNLYYPTSLWKMNETLVDGHTIVLAKGEQPHSMLIGMYSGPELKALAPSLTISLVDDGPISE